MPRRSDDPSTDTMVSKILKKKIYIVKILFYSFYSCNIINYTVVVGENVEVFLT